MMKLIAAIALILCHASSPSMSAHTVSIAENGSRPSQKGPAQAVLLDEASTVKINIRIADRVIPATLNGSKAAQDFASLLPLSLTLEDYASTEKISDLPKRLSTDGAPPGFDPSVGDITYYSPWGNLAIFYKDFDYSTGLVSLGTLASGADIFSSSGSMQATFELAKDSP
jgi:hypothetical protein